jgi:hypothetical protein
MYKRTSLFRPQYESASNVQELAKNIGLKRTRIFRKKLAVKNNLAYFNKKVYEPYPI